MNLKDLKFKINKKYVYVFIGTLIAFQPISLSYLSVGKLVENLQDIMFLGLTALFFLYKVKGYWKYKISIYIKLALLFDVIYFMATYNNSRFELNFIITYSFKKFILLCWIEYIIKHKKYKLWRAMSNALWLLIMIDFVTIVLYPNGLGGFGISGWVLGEKNNRFCYVFLASLLNLMEWYISPYKRKKKLLFSMIILELAGIASVILAKSSTSTIAVCVLTSFVLLYPIIKDRKIFNMYTYLTVHLAIWVNIVLFNTVMPNILSQSIQELTGKDATFSGRIRIWKALLKLIKEKPIMGYGFQSTPDNIMRTGISYYLNAHNHVLELLYTGGVVLLIIFIVILISCFMRNHNKKNIINALASWSIFALLFEFTQETIMQDFLLWVILLMIYHASEIGEYRYELFYRYGEKKKCNSSYERDSNFDGTIAPRIESNG